MWKAERGTQNRAYGRRGVGPTPRTGPELAVPRSAFRVPRLLSGATVLVLLTTACQGDGRTPLVIYSPHGRDLLTLLEHRFEQLHPDVDVRWLDMGSQEVYDRLRSERANPQADVWFGGPATIFARGARDSLLDQKIVRQEGLVTIWDLPDILLSRRDGLPLGYVFPKSGTPVIEDAIGVVRDARHRAQARAFVEYVGSVAAQLAAAREAYRLPARLDLPVDSLPSWARQVRSVMKVADVDWDLLAERGADWMRY